MDTRASAPKPQRVIPIAVAPAHDATAAAAMQRRRADARWRGDAEIRQHGEGRETAGDLRPVGAEQPGAIPREVDAADLAAAIRIDGVRSAAPRAKSGT